MPNRIIGWNVGLTGRAKLLNRHGASMSSSVARRRQPGRTPRTPQAASSRRPIIWSTLVVTTIWAIGTAAYFASRGDVSRPMADMQASYEKRIADLRAEFDHTTNQQLLDQSRIQQQVDALLQRQATLGQQTAATTDDQLATGSTSAKSPDASSIASASPVAKPARAPEVTKRASVRHRHGLRAQRRPAARPQQHAGDQAAPAAAQVDLGQRSYAPE
jgi:hypothetical protein